MPNFDDVDLGIIAMGIIAVVSILVFKQPEIALACVVGIGALAKGKKSQ